MSPTEGKRPPGWARMRPPRGRAGACRGRCAPPGEADSIRRGTLYSAVPNHLRTSRSISPLSTIPRSARFTGSRSGLPTGKAMP